MGCLFLSRSMPSLQIITGTYLAEEEAEAVKAGLVTSKPESGPITEVPMCSQMVWCCRLTGQPRTSRTPACSGLECALRPTPSMPSMLSGQSALPALTCGAAAAVARPQYLC